MVVRLHFMNDFLNSLLNPLSTKNDVIAEQ